MAYIDYSMSERAAAAYEEGLLPASKIHKTLPAYLVERYCQPDSWHHTSNRFNETNFFDPKIVLRTFGLIPFSECGEEEDDPFNPAAAEALALLKSSRSGKKEIFTGCRVEWLEWVGTRVHPQCIEKMSENCVVEIKGVTATITLPNGRQFKKRVKTKGFSFKIV